MELSELFLLAWAMIATVLAITYHHIAKRLRMALFVHQMGLMMIGEGKAKVIIEGDSVQVREI